MILKIEKPWQISKSTLYIRTVHLQWLPQYSYMQEIDHESNYDT